MLFDLQSRGRRRAVQVIFGGLAILFLIGFLGFGVGGGVGGGGVLNAVNNGQNGGGTSEAAIVKADRKAIAAHPGSAADWAKLTRDLYSEAGQGSNYDQTTDTFTSAGRGILAQVQAAWQHYLGLAGPSPNVDLASIMRIALGPNGLGDNTGALQAAQIVAAANPTATNFTFVAEYAYAVKNTTQGDLAAAQAVKLTPASGQAQLKTELAALKNPTGTTGAAGATTTVPAGSTTVTVPATTGSAKKKK